jgi:hypothetical protein
VVCGAAVIDSFETLGSLELHDSVLIGVDLCVQTKTCKVQLMLYETPDSTSRITATLVMGGVTSCAATLDFASLASNAKFGNIQNCRVDVDRNIVRLYLADGLLEVAAESVSLIREAQAAAR